MNDAIKPAQSRAGRALLKWSREKLAAEGKVPARTVADFELENTAPRASTLAAIRAALEAAGVEFTNGNAPGVRLLTERTKV